MISQFSDKLLIFKGPGFAFSEDYFFLSLSPPGVTPWIVLRMKTVSVRRARLISPPSLERRRKGHLGEGGNVKKAISF